MSQIADTGDIGVSIADSAILRLGMGNCPGFFCVSKANNLVAVLNFGSVCDTFFGFIKKKNGQLL